MKLVSLSWLAVLAMTAAAQNTSIRTTVPLVVVPASVTDRAGHSIDGLTAADFVVLDDGHARTVHVDTSDDALAPVSLVVAVESSDLSCAALAKIRKVGAMIPEAVVGDGGEAAIITF